MTTLRHLRIALCAASVLACSSDVTCLALPCALPLAATIDVSAPDAPQGIANLTMTVTGAITGSGPCDQTLAHRCIVVGGPGQYHVELRAPGYVTATRDFTVTGTSAGCNTCGQVDAQHLSVVLQPAGATAS